MTNEVAHPHLLLSNDSRISFSSRVSSTGFLSRASLATSRLIVGNSVWLDSATFNALHDLIPMLIRPVTLGGLLLAHTRARPLWNFGAFARIEETDPESCDEEEGGEGLWVGECCCRSLTGAAAVVGFACTISW